MNETPHTINEVALGRLKGTYRVRLNLWYFMPHLGLLVFASIGFAIYWDSGPDWKQYVWFALFLLFTAPFLWAVWATLPKIFDRLSVYENGFKYQHGRRISTCRWNEIEDVNEILDTDNRLKITSVTKHGGGKIAFAYKMRGTDLVSYEYSLFQSGTTEAEAEANSRIEEAKKGLGRMVASYRVKHGAGTFLPLGAVLFVAVFGSIAVVASRDIFSVFICAGPPIVLLCALLWNLYSDWRDELVLYENGFSYKNKKGIASCEWDEIADFSTTTRGGFLTGVKKEDGTWIGFANDMQGVDLIKPHVKKVIEWKGPEE